jgi:FtsZ family, C-terminal domain
VIDRNISFLDAMKQVDDVLAHAVRSIANLITRPGLINVDFADVKSVMNEAGTALMGMGVAKGDNRAKMAAQLAVSSPLLEISIDGAQGVLFNVIGGSDMTMQEVDEAANFISQSVDPNANIIFGAQVDESKKDEIEITVLATGFGQKEQQAILENRVDEMGMNKKSTRSTFGMNMSNRSPESQDNDRYEDMSNDTDRLRQADTVRSKFDDQDMGGESGQASGQNLNQDDRDALEERKRFGLDFGRSKSKPERERPGVSRRETSISDEDEDDLETPSFLRRKEY